MTDLDRFKLVNRCETLEELAAAIIVVADGENNIQGRLRTFNARLMAENCLFFDTHYSNTLTRSFGIRQQAIYIKTTENWSL